MTGKHTDKEARAEKAKEMEEGGGSGGCWAGGAGKQGAVFVSGGFQ